MSTAQNVIRTITGTVVSNKMHKTIVVKVVRTVKHETGKYIKRTTKLHAHDEQNSCAIGDTVRIKECRPISKTKTWQLVDILVKAQGLEE